MSDRPSPDLIERIENLGHSIARPSAFGHLELSSLASDPFEQFTRWLEEALAARIPQPLGMTLATASKEGKPSARVVLLRGYDERGFVFYTNYKSQKGRELAENPYGALVFWWEKLNRQVRIEGSVSRVGPEESNSYFAKRPRGSQLAAWVSEQSQFIAGRGILTTELQALDLKFGGREIPRPQFWGGYRLAADGFEFWQEGPNRLHDRFLYRKSEEKWAIERLAP